MKKWLGILFLYLGIILLSGYCLLSTHTYKDGNSYSSFRANEFSQRMGLAHFDQQSIFKASHPEPENKDLRIVAVEKEVEEDEFFSEKKHSKLTTDVRAQLQLHFPLYLFHGITTRLPVEKHFQFFAFSRYLTYQVIRL